MINELPTISKILFVVFIVFLMQALGGYYQIKDYRKAIKRMHKLGNVGIGQKRGKFFNGNIVMIASDNEGIITGAEILDGISFLAKFHPVNEFLDKELVGNSIYSFLEITDEFDKKKRKKYQGWIRALEAIRSRFEGKEL
ncbi:MAG: transcriptional regulator GutM [Eubacteriales bacterium]|nr:transcriptional regulator GutM [Eubacteriales bacterium]